MLSKNCEKDSMSKEIIFNRTVSNIFKASLVGILAVVITVIPLDQFIAQFFGIPFGEFRGGMPTPYFLGWFLIYTAMAFVLARMKEKLNVSKRGVFLIVFTFHYFIVSFLPNLEGRIYLPDFPFVQALIGGLILALAVVSLIFYLWKQEDNPEAEAGQQIKSHFSSRSVMSWVWRFFVVWLLFFVVTMIFSIVALPFNQPPFLDDAANTLGMTVPSMGTLFVITQFRSLVYILVTLPFIVFWRSGKRELFLYLALINVIQYPLLGDGLAYWWPVMYRLVDGIVLTLQITVMSWLYVTLLWKGKKT
jgi:hypothetical protein